MKSLSTVIKSTLFLILSNYCLAQNFTDTKGTLEITDSGQATYSIPIAMPPSINNFAPVINLEYLSGSGGGIAGQGWKINSISNISRIASRKDLDGNIDGVDFDYNDRLALDGQRLILKSGGYWGNNSVYQTEFKNNIKIELKIEGGAYVFIVTNTDGSRSWYGNIGSGDYQNAKSENAWYIVKHEDAHRNYIKYNYQSFSYGNSTQLYIKEILFSGNYVENISAINKITFNYMPLARVERDYINSRAVYASQLLNNIQVSTNNNLFREYKIYHTTDDMGYSRVNKVEELNSSGEVSNPVIFDYYTTPHDARKLVKTYDNNLNFSDINPRLTADYDGDGRLDFVAGQKLYNKLFVGSAGIAPTISTPPRSYFPITTTTNGKLNQFQSLVSIDNDNLYTHFKVYNLEGGQFVEKYTKTIYLDRTTTNTLINNTGSTYGLACYGYFQSQFQPTDQNSIVSYLEGDFDGDGITDVLVTTKKTNNNFVNGPSYPNPYPNPFDPNLCNLTNNPSTSYQTSLINLNPSVTSFYTTTIPNFPDLSQGKYRVADFNGDGKSDILIYNNQSYSIKTFDPLNSNQFITLGYGVFTGLNENRQLNLGDFNGDGKTDVIIPNSDGCSTCTSWSIYYSNPRNTPGDFFVRETLDIDKYLPSSFAESNQYFFIDTNNDGKTDFVKFKYRQFYESSNGWQYLRSAWSVELKTNVIGKIGESNGFITTYNSGETEEPYARMPTPLASNYTVNKVKSDLILIKYWNDLIVCYEFLKDFNADNRLKTVSEANGNILQEIEYSALASSDDFFGDYNLDFYASNNNETYPNVEIIRSPDTYLVSKLTATVNGIPKYKSFKYRGLVVNLNHGILGFKKTARSGWYLQPSDIKLWNVKEKDMTLRGATIRESTVTQEATLFSSYQLGLQSYKNSVFDSYLNPTTKVFNILLREQTTKDENTHVKSIKQITYDADVSSDNCLGLETQSNVSYYSENTLQGSVTVATEYENNTSGTGTDFYIGRPKIINTTQVLGGDSRTSEDKFFYSGANLIRKETRGHNTDYLIETYGHDNFGNLTSKTISAPNSIPPIAARTNSDIYDQSGRFVKTKIDVNGFVKTLEYNHFGLVKKETNHLGVVNEYEYDDWGKLRQTKVSGSSTSEIITNYQYLKNSDGAYTKIETNNGTNEVKFEVFDVLGRIVREKTKGFGNGSTISIDTKYDGLGRKIKVSEPYFSSPSKYTLYEYDYLNRIIKVTHPTSPSTRIQTINYSGLTTISDDDGRIKTTTLDSLGNKIQTTDQGGTVVFSYFADGSPKSIVYENNTIDFEIDGWGNRTLMFDRNTGKYTYSYNAFGEIISEVKHGINSDTGETTYQYDDFGKIKKKILQGDGTDFIIEYQYDETKGLILKESSKNSLGAEIDSYEYEYDSFNRLHKQTEKNNNFEHSTTIEYDQYGRKSAETSATQEKLQANFTSSFKTKYYYNNYNGILDKITDENDVVLWQLNTANEKMQALTSVLGNGVLVSNLYDDNFNPREIEHMKNNTQLLNYKFHFEGKRGNLLQRTISSTTEFFGYDVQDRLINWTNTQTNSTDYNVYDNKGRITINNKVGEIRYNNNVSTGIYRKDHIKLNSEGQLHFGALGNQLINYTMFKAPISINESNKGKLDFVYNSHLARMKMDYDYGIIPPSIEKVQRKTKLYTDDGSTEIIYNQVDHTVKIITYVGGDAYDGFMFIDRTLNINDNNTTENSYYLHRDYLGSILAISSQAGVVVEKRNFDAWGNITNITDSAGNSIDVSKGFPLLDRGYTGHEHLYEVGLINMNGRLYDPKLRGFLMPDNFVQSPENTQSYNRYAYCWNNPLKYSDPSGEFLIEAIVIGAIVGALMYTYTCLTNNAPITLDGVIFSSLMGGVSGAVSFGIGSASASLCTNFFARAGVEALAHGLFQGGLAGAQGGSFWTGFAAGALSSLAASAWSGGTTTSTRFQTNANLTSGHFVKETITHQGIGGALGMGASSSASMIVFGAISGGVGATLTGGNFWVGAATGLVVSGLNHAMHKIDGDIGFDKDGKKINDNGGDKIDYRYDNDGSIISSTAVEVFGHGNIAAQRGYGYKIMMATGAITDDTLNFASNFMGAGEMYKGGKMIAMGLTKVLKSSVGIRTVLGASKYTLKSSVYYEKVLGRHYIDIFGIKSLPTLRGTSYTWGTFVGRNAPIIGAGRIGFGGYLISQ